MPRTRSGFEVDLQLAYRLIVSARRCGPAFLGNPPTRGRHWLTSLLDSFSCSDRFDNFFGPAGVY